MSETAFNDETVINSFPENYKIGSLIEGKIIKIGDATALVDVSLKSEGEVNINEFGEKISIGDKITVLLEKIEDKKGKIVLSHKKAIEKLAWIELEKIQKNNSYVSGLVKKRTKKGFEVEITGLNAFILQSEIDSMLVKTNIVGQIHDFMISELSYEENFILLSRKDVQKVKEKQQVQNLQEVKVNDTFIGIVRGSNRYNISLKLDNGMEGIIHHEELFVDAKIGHKTPKYGDQIQVKVSKINLSKGQIILVPYISDEEWKETKEFFDKKKTYESTVIKIFNNGLFIDFENKRGFVPLQELDWKYVNSYQKFKEREKIEVKPIDFDEENKRVILSRKICITEPWDKVASSLTEGQEIIVKTKKVIDKGLIAEIKDGICGFIPKRDISWNQKHQFKSGDEVKVMVKEIDKDKKHFLLDAKRISTSSLFQEWKKFKEGQIVTCEIKEIKETHIEVSIGSFNGSVSRGEISRIKKEKNTGKFGKGERIDAKIIKLDEERNTLKLSIKAKEEEEHKKIIEKYGSEDSGATLGEIIGDNLIKR